MKYLVLAFTLMFMHSPVTQAEDVRQSNDELRINLDSLQANMARTDSLLQILEEKQEELMQKQQDEMLEKSLEQNQLNLERFLADQQARKKESNRRLVYRGGILVISLIVLIVSQVQRRRKGKSKV